MPSYLIIKPSSFGDIIHGLQVAAAIKDQQPEARIDWVARDIFAPLVQSWKGINEVFVYHRKGGWGDFLGLLKKIRSGEYDFVLDMQGLARSGIMTMAAKARRKMGRRDAREGSQIFCNQLVALPSGPGPHHALEILGEFLPALGLKQVLDAPLEFESARPRFEDDFLLLFPDSRRPEKEWPHFRELTRQLIASTSTPPVIWAGTSGPEPDPEWPEERFQNLMGETEIAELPELIGRAKLVVANDSGPMHLAAALGRPVVALFGPTDPDRFGPYPMDSDRHQILRPDEGIASLSVEAVALAVGRGLNG